ncbi:hypothetical protein PVK06_025102 [Gossypium arboreum]|uniref:DUF4216 domain-containing protein n=1 Tax=Gossypium arboreum TaxID=29729 RepID=A0ABR0PFH4_GOSAR|nr:hypothetical protein PVK06_025102 [Gossypium arboreum]
MIDLGYKHIDMFFFTTIQLNHYASLSGKDVNDDVKWLSQGPNRVVKRYSAFLINGFRFHTKSHERLKRTQNCGIVVNSSIKSYASARDSNLIEGNVEYHRLLTDIIELDYYGKRKVVLFRCDWADINTARGIKKDQFGFTMVNFSRLIHTGQQLIDESNLFDIGNGSRDDIDERSETLPFPEQNLNENIPSTIESSGTRRTRGCTLLKDLYELNFVERVEVARNSLGQPVGSETQLLEQSSGQKVRRLHLFDISHRKKDGSLMTTKTAEIMEKLKDKRAKYEEIASSDSSVNLDDIDNQIITEVLGTERYGWVRFQGSFVNPTQYLDSAHSNTCFRVVKLKLKFRG